MRIGLSPAIVGKRRVSWGSFTSDAEVRERLTNPVDWPIVRTAAWTVTAFLGLVLLFRIVLPIPVPLGMLLFGIVIGSTR